MPAPRRRRRLRFLLWVALSVACLVLVIAGAGFTLLNVGIGGDMVTQQARAALRSVMSPQASSSIGAARISIDKRYHIALEANDVGLEDLSSGLSIPRIRSIKLGLSPLALLMGRIEVARIEIDGADIKLANRGQDAAALSGFVPLDRKGLVNLGNVSNLILSRLSRLAGLLDRHHTDAVVFNNVSLTAMRDGKPQVLDVQNLELAKTLTGLIQLKGGVAWQGKPIKVSASVARDTTTRAVKDFDVRITGIPFTFGAKDTAAHLGKPGGNLWDDMRIGGRVGLQFSGTEGGDGRPTTISGRISLLSGEFKYLNYPKSAVTAKLNFEQAVGSHKIELKPSSLKVGGLSMNFNGAFGPAPAGTQGTDDKPAYRFEIVTSDAVSAPRDSPAPALPFGARVAGLFIPDEHNLSIREIGVRTSGGELYGQGSVIFGEGSPAIIFALRIPRMPVSQVKQLWPLPVADGARRWILPNIFGGSLTDGRIDIAFAPGRFSGPGDPPPLGPDEVKVDASVVNTRFDIVGDLPAVRDASGHVTVRGAHTTVQLDKGTAYLPSGRTAAISNGHLTIPWGPQRPVIAGLNIDVAGDAGAIAEIVGYKPINALHYVDFGPGDVSGKVTSHIAVSFPITRDPPPGSTTWSANMDFSDVSITKPLDGQTVTDATGTLKVTQQSAAVDTKAKLNGIPAKVTLFEPLGDGNGKRQRTVALELDDKDRARLMPQLNTLLSGPVFVNLANQSPGREIAAADLTKAALTIPWVGWSKGAGVNATATFSMDTRDGKTEISGLDISGSTFRIRGDLTLDANGLRSADFKEVRLNKGDNATVHVDRTRHGYSIDVNGSSLDVRALIKQLKADFGKKDGDAGKEPNLAIHASLDSATGYNGEVLHGVKIDYQSAPGSKSEKNALTATTASGAKLTFSSSTQGGGRETQVHSADAGAVLRFFDLYSRMKGGNLEVSLTGSGDAPLAGTGNIRNFTIVQDPNLAEIVSGRPSQGGRSLNETVKKRIDVSSVLFTHAFSKISIGGGRVALDRGVLRGPTIGATFQGTLIDPDGNMALTGTFMPAYGLNSIFGAIPLVGQILGNGRERGLIGITYKIQGPAKNPRVMVNPISIIAPGVFRSIFEFR